MIILTARWVLPMCSSPIENGAVAIDGKNIVFVGSLPDVVTKASNVTIYDYGQAIIVPGFINLHTHLEYSWLAHHNCSDGLFKWIQSLVSCVRSWQDADFLRSALYGARQAIRSGTTCVVDCAPTQATALALALAGMRGVVGLELYGRSQDKSALAWGLWQEKFKKLSQTTVFKEALPKAIADGRIRLTVAPHTLYTVCPALISYAVDWADQHNLPVLMHLAESVQECAWIAGSNKELDDFLLAGVAPELVHGLSWKGHGLSPVEHLEHHGLLRPNMLAAHVVHVSQSDIEILAGNHVKVAHCPRSNARLRNGIAPLSALVSAGVEVGFGTDSFASCDDLDILAEARFAFNVQRATDPAFNWSAENAIYRLTAGAAKILNIDSYLGSLSPGKLADIGVFKLDGLPGYAQQNPFESLLYGGTTLCDLFVNGTKVVNNSCIISTEAKIEFDKKTSREH